MMRCFALYFILLLFALPSGAAAQTEATIDLADDFVPISQDFDGANMTLFGALQSTKSDIVVTIKGPPAKALVRAKVRQMGIWVNAEPEVLESVTSYYAVLSSRPITEIAPPAFWQKLAVGYDSLNLNSKAGENFLQSRIAKGLYATYDTAVKIRDKKLFRADLRLPPNVPVGTYEATVYEIQGKAVKAQRTTHFTIAQVGTGGLVKELAHKSAILYAVLSLSLVLLFGATGAYLFRKVS